MKSRTFSLCILSALLLALLTPQPASAVAGGWAVTGEMETPRAYHTATLLPNGVVLVAAGYNTTISSLASAELYDPVEGAWGPTGSLATGRQNHTATLLPSGKVLVTGGYDITFKPLASAELYEFAAGGWTGAAAMGAARVGHSATLLANGKVLVAGGNGPTGGGALFSAELYDPAANSWTPTGSLHVARAFHTAVRLLSGKVLVMGGRAPSTLASAELYDPATGQWTSTDALATNRYAHTATLLPDGKVLVAGGLSAAGAFLASAELYDPAAGAWSPTGSLATAREFHGAALLPNGRVLIAGGWNNTRGGYLSSAELYDPATGAWSATGSLVTARENPAFILLPDGNLLAAGGSGAAGTLKSAERYTPVPGGGTRTFRSAGRPDGWVLETSENSNRGGTLNATGPTFILGDTANRRQYRAILHFNTSALPDDATVTRAVLKIRKHSLTGANPFTTHGKILVDIRQGAFSGVGALQLTDFQAGSSQPSVGAFTGIQRPVGWYVVRLNAAAHPLINLAGITQFRLRFQRDDDNDAVADFLRFFSGDAAPASRPILVVEYSGP